MLNTRPGVRRRIARTHGRKQVRQIASMYAAAYEGTGMTAEDIWEEVICDSLGDMNIFAGKIVEDEAGVYLTHTKDAAQSEKVESRQERGPSADGKMSREAKTVFQREFTGSVTSDEYVYLSGKEKAAISHALKTGYGQIEPGGMGGRVSTADYCYLFDITQNSGVKVTDIIANKDLNIHGNYFEEVYDDGEQRDHYTTGEKPEIGRRGQRDGDHGVFASEETREGRSNDRLVGEEQGGDPGRNLPKVQRTGESVTSKSSLELDNSTSITEGQQTVQTDIQAEVREEVRAQLARMGKEYGFIPPGENPARVIELPRRTAPGNKVSQTARTILEAEATPDELVPSIENLVADGILGGVLIPLVLIIYFHGHLPSGQPEAATNSDTIPTYVTKISKPFLPFLKYS